MSAPCPFCGFAASDYRESHNWRCAQCGKDYADWLTIQKAKAKEESGIKKQPLFAKQKLPPEAEPVRFAQHLFLFAILFLLALNFVIEGIFAWVFPVSIPFAGYYALMVHKTGYALGQHAVYTREKNPIMYKAHLWGVGGYMILALVTWIEGWF